MDCSIAFSRPSNPETDIKKRYGLMRLCAAIVICACLCITTCAQAAVSVEVGATKRLSLTENQFLAYLTYWSWSSSDPSICSIVSGYSDGAFSYATVRGVSVGTCRVSLLREWVTRAGQYEGDSCSWTIEVTASETTTATPTPTVTVTPKPTPTATPKPDPVSGTVGSVNWAYNSKTATLSFTGSGVIPDYTDEERSPWRKCKWYSSVKTVSIGSGITDVGNRSFYSCGSLTTLKLSDSVVRIGTEAFDNCYHLTNITWPRNLKRIDQSAFYACSALSELNLSSVSVEYIGNSAFSHCNLSSLVLPKNEPSMGGEVFSNNTRLTNITIPEGYKIVNGFRDCTALQSVRLPSTLSEISPSAFSGCTALQSVRLPSTLSKIGAYAFRGATSLQHIDIPGGVTFIGSRSFQGSGLVEVTIPQMVTTISQYAFADCTALQSVAMSRGVDTIEAEAFSGCTALKSVCLPATVNKKAFYNCASLSEVTYLSNSLRIFEDAFYGCSSLSFANLPENLTIEMDGLRGMPLAELRFIGNRLSIAKWGCPQVKDVYVAAKSAQISEYAFYKNTALRNVTLCMDSGSIDFAAFGETTLQSLNLRGTMTISDGAFFACKSLSSVTLPENGTYAPDFSHYHNGIFKNCSALRTLRIPDGVENARTLLENTFYLETILIPASVTNIYYRHKGNSLKVYYAGTREQWTALMKDYQYEDTDILHKIDISFINFIQSVPTESLIVTPTPLPTLAPYVTPEPTPSPSPAPEPTPMPAIIASGASLNEHVNWILTDNGTLTIYSDGTAQNDYLLYGIKDYEDRVTEVSFAGGITAVCDMSGFSRLEEVYLPVTITAIGEGAFSSNPSLRRISMPGVVTIESNAFGFCEALVNVEIPDTCKTIASEAFHHCTALKKIALPDTLTEIADKTFYGCYALEAIVIPEGVTTIGEYAFDSCRALTSVTLPASLKRIGDWCFAEKPNKVYYMGTDAQWEQIEIGNHNDGLNGRISRNKDFCLPVGMSVIKAEAFQGSGIKSFDCNADLTRIESRAFADCGNLVYINIHNGISYIAPDAFANSPNVIIVCPEGSLAQKWAEAYKVDCITENNESR